MYDAPSILTRLTTWRQGLAVVGLVALALLNISTAAHQFEHSIEHDAGHHFEHGTEHDDEHGAEHHVGFCKTCATYSQLEDIAVPIAPAHETFSPSDDAVTTPQTATNRAPVPGTHRSRAPPSS